MIDREQVLHTAKLARLELTEDEIAGFTTQLGAIFAHINQLDELDVSGVEPTCFMAPSHDPLRSDSETQSLPHDTALANGPSVKKGHFAVPKIIGSTGGA